MTVTDHNSGHEVKSRVYLIRMFATIEFLVLDCCVSKYTETNTRFCSFAFVFVCLHAQKVLRPAFGPEREVVTGGCRKLNKQLHNVYSSNIFRLIKCKIQG
jgi:hypothetical protein